jgi:ActR/RegA family two-component response regulator
MTPNAPKYPTRPPVESQWLEQRAKPAKLLLLDDDDHFCGFISDICSRYNVELVIAHTIREAISLAIEPPMSYDAMILDVRLSNGTGMQFYAKAAALWPTLRVVFLTGFDSAEVRDQIEKIGPARVHNKNNVANENFLKGLFAQWDIKPIVQK